MSFITTSILRHKQRPPELKHPPNYADTEKSTQLATPNIVI
ncbi:hypothetical protein F442_11661 [Phytophthora nicotianae P10297]|uniref:Uncharacterized protein n=1 Tax=Phytophthora nicotianae P10297 TaxID=1317064 RepID=W2Z152_PHYNI|nr:hypothetical protein F442_11661 [Phytophthora nicotianae P10297]